MVKRYRCQNPDAEFYEQPLGEWVDFDDYDALAARLAEEEHDHENTLKQRDDAEAMADKLAAAVATLLGVEIGEHSSGNCPWTAALEAFEERPTDSASLAQE